MSVVIHEVETRGVRLPNSLLARLAVAGMATAVVGLGLAVLGYLVFATGLVAAPAPRNPFATGSAGFAMATSGIGGVILTIQAHFYAALTAAVQALKADGVGLMSLATIGFLYGIFHAAGPGHGKAVISGYIIASKGSISHGLALSLAAALLQAVVAISVVGVFAVLLEATATTINAAARNIELASFAAVAAMGAILLWTKSGEFVRLIAAIRNGVIPDEDKAASDNWRVFAGVVLAAGDPALFGRDHPARLFAVAGAVRCRRRRGAGHGDRNVDHHRHAGKPHGFRQGDGATPRLAWRHDRADRLRGLRAPRCGLCPGAWHDAVCRDLGRRHVERPGLIPPA
jgi:ABC-type nickel/cobalt efflux system permease component RcnA